MRWGWPHYFALLLLGKTSFGLQNVLKVRSVPRESRENFEMLQKSVARENFEKIESPSQQWDTHYFPALPLLTTGSHWLVPLTVWCSCCCSPPSRWRTRTFGRRFSSPIFKPSMFNVPKLVVVHNVHNGSEKNESTPVESVGGWNLVLVLKVVLHCGGNSYQPLMICVTNMFTSWQLLPLNQHLIDWLLHWAH